MTTPASVVDLFCGAGGLTRGFLDEGFSVKAGFDIDPACQYPYKQNNRVRFFRQDVTALKSEKVKRLLGDSGYRVLAGCAPCQKFSTYTRGREGVESEKWGLLSSFAKLVTAVKPDVVTMENVIELKRHPVFQDFLDSLADSEYRVTKYEVDCREHGVPQQRKRLVVFGSLHGDVNLAAPTHAVGDFLTVKEAIGNVEPLAAGVTSKSDPIHRSSDLSKLNLKRIQASKPGGTWRDWNESLRAECHKKASGKTYASVYGRMAWDAPSPTITTQAYGYGNGRFGHPEQDRGLSLREMALLQTFPENYQFVRPGDHVHMTTVGRLIGNAVPVALGQAIARSIRLHLEALP